MVDDELYVPAPGAVNKGVYLAPSGFFIIGGKTVKTFWICGRIEMIALMQIVTQHIALVVGPGRRNICYTMHMLFDGIILVCMKLQA